MYSGLHRVSEPQLDLRQQVLCDGEFGRTYRYPAQRGTGLIELLGL